MFPYKKIIPRRGKSIITPQLEVIRNTLLHFWHCRITLIDDRVSGRFAPTHSVEGINVTPRFAVRGLEEKGEGTISRSTDVFETSSCAPWLLQIYMRSHTPISTNPACFCVPHCAPSSPLPSIHE